MRGTTLWIFALLVALGAAFAPAQAATALAGNVGAARCSAALGDTGPLTEALASQIAWRCPADFSDISQPRQLIRFTLSPERQADPPRVIVGRIAAFGSLTVAYRDPNGRFRSHTRAFGDLRPTWFDRQFAVPLPKLPAATEAIYVAIDHPTQAIPLDYLRLERTAPGASEAERAALLLAALLCGLVLMPLLFDGAFYRVLREPFILWHAAFVGCMAAQLILTTGLYLVLVEPSLTLVRAATVGSFGLMVVASAMFLSTFVEKHALSPAMRRALLAASVWQLAATLLHAPGFTALGGLPAKIFYLSGFPVTAVFLAAVCMAWRNGSRMVRYIVAGFAPLVAVAVVRIVSFALPGVPTQEATGLFLAGMLIEVSATALGVANRFLALKNERDRAKAEARTLESLAGRDHLTGLMNRRAIEPRFAELHRAGYDTFALLDLDNFKSVNDVHGHAVGDAVLRAAAGALRGDDETLAMRLGGEEFLLLLRGPDAAARAERIRTAIPTRVARDVDGLARIVTASMGLVVAPHPAMPRARFKDIYVMADKLLYEAKAAGRNLTMSERVRAFGKPRLDRRRAA